ncbi:MAG TPA: dihydropteroate synthase [Candidatus Corynebacterium gallistercoris]|uniref:dihydropteroate synthase n=1 Tax=Candidatus Corynebacterium gallistercoris TaxID=2838530 RepID=A0A9D1UR90_9CORY|nr:dihydropteroate synthase [Candidatus Corynebacterium gallistercoris]
MGILNVTEDSFSDGGSNPTTAIAVENAKAMVAAGADIIDVGGESTRPGAVRVDAGVEAARVAPVIAALAAEGIPTSVDTMRASTAEAALTAGATYVNDVSGGLADPDMLAVCADFRAPAILMHWNRGESFGAEGRADHGEDIVEHVAEWLAERAEAAHAAGVREVILDPGIGFAKSAEDNWALLGGMDRLTSQGYPLLIGASRKRFLAALNPNTVDEATAAVSTLAAAGGAWAVRVHKVAPSRAAVDVAAQWTAHRRRAHG